MVYVALLRGINVGGNNKVAMTDLKACFKEVGFLDVSTYINSGNVIFRSSEKDKLRIMNKCTEALHNRFGFMIACNIISANELNEIIDNAPSWWDIEKTDKNNLLFVIPPVTPADVMEQMGEAKPEYESVEACGSAIFWTAPFATFGRTRYSKIVGTDLYKSVTIRNSNTARKLAKISREY